MTMNRVWMSIVLITLAMGVAAQKPTMEITGFAEKSIVPDEVIFNINLSVEEAEFGKTVDKLNEQMNRLKEKLRGAGVSEDRMKTSNYNVSENIKYESGKRTKLGYRGTHSLIVKAPFQNENLKNIHNSIVVADVDLNFNISFGISDAKMYQEELMVLAMTDARQKAEILSRAAGMTLGLIKSISYGQQPISYPMRNYSSAMAMDRSAEIDINPGNLKLSDRVFVVFELEAK